jgi:type I restriction enzyme S subunit
MKADGGKYPLVALSDERRSHSEYQFDAKAVIVPLISSTGHGHASMKRVHYQEGKFALGNILCAVIPNDETQLNAKYLHLYLQQFKETLLVPLMKGAANVSLPMNKLADVEIEVPSLERQLEIIELEEEAAEYKNELEERLIAQNGDVSKLRQALLREAIQGKLTSQDAKDGNAKDLLVKIKTEKAKSGKKEKPLPSIKPEEIPFEIPENWVWCRLGEACVINPRNKADENIDAAFIPMPMISQKYNEPPQFEVRKWGAIKSGFTHFSNDDVVVAKITPCFENSKAGIMKNLPNGIGAGTTELHVIRGNGFVLPEYIYAFIKTPEFLANGERIMRGVAGQQRVPSEYFYESLIPLPPFEEQNRIVNRIEQLLQLCDELQYSIQQSKIENEKLLQGALKDALKKEEVEV